MHKNDRTTNPVFGPQPFKIGLFGYLHDGGNALTVAPERWRARWNDIASLAKAADRGGFDFMLPIARWKGVPGKVNNRLWSYETLTSAAVLAGITERIGVFATVHTPIVHPVVAAKALATIDHASNGRAGVNIVCGWNQQDFDMLGLTITPHDDRYQQGEEWFELLARLLSGSSEEFDYDTKYFPKLKGVVGQPGSIQQPYPATFSAAFSPRGRDFAVKYSDFLLLGFVDPDAPRRDIADIRSRSEAIGRAKPPGVFGTLAPFIRETREEAQAFHHYFAVENADHEAIAYYTGQRSPNASSPSVNEQRQSLVLSSGGVPVVGTPEDLVDVFVKLHEQGYAGVTLTLPHFTNDLPIIIERVFPLLERAGLRLSQSAVPATT
jgi:alkanesulfonate monooxygenase SsuD/methylene tetrahydromethanopterin reductase-like flavin-dependent oxidoreductase (luciferase family)